MTKCIDSDVMVLKAKRSPHPKKLEVIAAVIAAIAMLIHGNWELSVISIAILFVFKVSNIKLMISNSSLQYKVGKVDVTIDLNNIASLKTKESIFVGKKILITTKEKVIVLINNKKADARRSFEVPDVFEHSPEEISDMIWTRLNNHQPTINGNQSMGSNHANHRVAQTTGSDIE